MTCDDARDMFSLLADDALTPLERAALDAHLADCAECRRELASFERTVKLVRAIDPVHAPAGFVERVLAAAQPGRAAPKQSAPATQSPESAPQPSAHIPQPSTTTPPPVRERPAPLPERPAPRRAWPWRTLPLSAAALLVIGGLAILLFRGSPEQQRAAQQQLEPPPVATVPAPPSEAPPAPAPPSPELQKPAAPASKPPKTRAKPPTTTSKRSETAGERKAPSEEQRNVAPPQVAEQDSGAKVESSESGQDKDKRDIAQDRVAPASPSRERQAAALKAQAPSQASPLSRTGPTTGAPAAAPDVTAQLHVADVRSGERTLIALATRVGGRQTGRRVDAGRIIVDLAVPRETYPQFVRDAGALGSMSIERQDTTDRPMLAVAVTLSR